MSAADFSIRIKGLRPAEQALGRLARRFGDLLPLMDRIGELLVLNTKHRFETGRGPDGVSWKPSGRARVEAVPGKPDVMGPQSSKTLVRDGHLRDSITHLPSPTSVEIGSNLLYARIHQLGGTIVPKEAAALVFRLPDGELVHASKVIIPARPYLGFDAVDARGVESQTERFAEEAIV